MKAHNSTLNNYKVKKCKGTGKAINRGCGEKKVIFKYGLCQDCFKSFLYSTTEGGEIMRKIFVSVRKNTIKIKRIEKAKAKELILTKKELEDKLQFEVNYIVRRIDENYGCISCKHGNNEPFTMQAHASHYHSRGARPELRYNLHNIHKSCSKCNNYMHGNIHGYDIGLIYRYSDNYMIMVKDELKPLEKLEKYQLQNMIKAIRKEKKRLAELLIIMNSLEIRDYYNDVLFNASK